jgi:hypothetical protein
MRQLIFAAGAAVLLASCNKADDAAANQAAAPPKKKVAHCFFKDSETKGWSASRDKDGNIVVKGKAYRSDSRYQAVLGPPDLSGTAASIAPTITPNTGAFGAEDDWWDVKAMIPNSAAVDTVTVKCGEKTLATLAVKPKA